MKKVIFSLLILLCATGCYDNIELNDLDIVSGIGISYEENKYVVTYEIINTKKTKGSNDKSFSHTGSGKTIEEAFSNTELTIDRKPYFPHLKLLIFHNSITEDKLQNIMEYLIRSNNIRTEFNLVYTSDSPKEILESSNEHNPIVSFEIVEMLKNSKYTTNSAIDEKFEQIMGKILNDLEDPIISTIKLDKNEIKLSKGILLHDYAIIDYLSLKDTSLYRLIMNESNGTSFRNEYEKGDVTINCYDSNIKLEIKDNTIVIKGSSEALILNNNAEFNLRDKSSYQTLNKDFSNIINKQVTDLVKALQFNQTDILSLADMYYDKTRIKNQNGWTNYKIDVDIDVHINKKGFIFEVNYEK